MCAHRKHESNYDARTLTAKLLIEKLNYTLSMAIEPLTSAALKTEKPIRFVVHLTDFLLWEIVWAYLDKEYNSW